MTLLTICQDVAAEIGTFETPSTIVGNNNETAGLLLAMAKREVQTLARLADWTELTKETTFSTVASQEAYTITGDVGLSDFDRIVDGTMFDRTNRWEVSGPVPAQRWQRIKADNVQASARLFWRIRGGSILIYPTPSDVRTIYFEYVSAHVVEDSGGTGQATWAADDDVCVLPERLVTMGLRWRFLQRHGMPYEDQFNEWASETERAIVRDGGKRVLDLSGMKAPLGIANFPESGYGA
jgi:hypothetical protein